MFGYTNISRDAIYLFSLCLALLSFNHISQGDTLYLPSLIGKLIFSTTMPQSQIIWAQLEEIFATNWLYPCHPIFRFQHIFSRLPSYCDPPNLSKLGTSKLSEAQENICKPILWGMEIVYQKNCMKKNTTLDSNDHSRGLLHD